MSANACFNTAAFSFVASPVDASACRIAANAGPTFFMMLSKACSSADIGAGSRFARSTIFELITEVASTAGFPRYFATRSGDKSTA